jgi:hypothetical protein
VNAQGVTVQQTASSYLLVYNLTSTHGQFDRNYLPGLLQLATRDLAGAWARGGRDSAGRRGGDAGLEVVVDGNARHISRRRRPS